MTENLNPNDPNEVKYPAPAPEAEEMALDDARRVKVLSPGMLVFKRFIRNRLAVVGLGILVVMFLFAFVGPVLSPYTQTQVFKGIGSMSKDYASATYNTELRYTVAEGETFTPAERAQFLLALGKNTDTFTVGTDAFYISTEGENFYRILQLDPIAEELLGKVNPLNGAEISDELIAAYYAAKEAGQTSFSLDGVKYRLVSKKKSTQIATEHDVAIGSLMVFDPYEPENTAKVNSYEFKLASGNAIASGLSSFKVGDEYFKVEENEGQFKILDFNGNDFAVVSDIIVNPLDQGEFLSVDFKTAIRQAIDNRQNSFTFPDPDGKNIEYDIVRVNTIYNIKKETPLELIRMYENPSSEHLLGLDNNGMDLMTRLMYGGQVSLMVGFVVIFLEMFLGVIVGGISGYFGGWVDTALMRFVDLFNSIPFYPMVLIFGSVMDALQVDPIVRIFLLMGVLGILGWTGVARVVRGQILSLREQDFMVATEATGIPTSRRIFRHLVPNVMPLLIVQATAGLGGIIITEATLGFLGLGIKYPLASWGSIINVASDAYVMTNFWFMWLPAGMLILLTVLGFNFVGDGLRDAFDPKMKR
jgi:peptide/nickel transport system permease protein